jgi:hypothetical protein
MSTSADTLVTVVVVILIVAGVVSTARQWLKDKKSQRVGAGKSES